MNFLLKNLELYLNDHQLINGEKLFEEGKVLNLFQADTHLWVGEVLGHEVEIQLTPSKVKDCSCECKNLAQNNLCEHIAAVLYKIRKEKITNEDKKNKKIFRKRIPKKLTTSSIFEFAKKEELIAFMKQYAKSNRQFALTLKARFAASVPMEDSYHKYASLIDATANLSRRKDDSFSHQGSLIILGIAKELLGQAMDEIALENLNESFVILKCIIKKMAPLIQKMEKNQEKFKEFIKASFLNINKIIIQNPAPQLMEEIRLFCLEECTKEVYKVNDLTLPFFDLLFIISKGKKEINYVIQLLENELITNTENSDLKANMIILKMKFLEALGLSDEVEKVVQKNQNNPKIILAVTESFFEKNDMEKAEIWAENGLRQRFPKMVNQSLNIFLLKISVRKKDANKIQVYARFLFKETLNFEYYKILKEYSGKNWNHNFQLILEDVKSLSFSIKKRDAIAQMYVLESQKNALFDYVSKFGSIDLLRNFDKHLLPERKKEIYQLHHDFLNNYLSNHFGSKSAERAQETINHLFEIGADDLAKKMISQIHKDYPERISLKNLN